MILQSLFYHDMKVLIIKINLSAYLYKVWEVFFIVIVQRKFKRLDCHILSKLQSYNKVDEHHWQLSQDCSSCIFQVSALKWYEIFMYNYVKSNYVKNIINSKRLSYSCKHLSSNKKY